VEIAREYHEEIGGGLADGSQQPRGHLCIPLLPRLRSIEQNDLDRFLPLDPRSDLIQQTEHGLARTPVLIILEPERRSHQRSLFGRSTIRLQITFDIRGLDLGELQRDRHTQAELQPMTYDGPDKGGCLSRPV
jgi:hypothetical protein